MWESRSDFQGRWEGWKTCCWFSRLSTAPTFPQLFVFRGSSVFLLTFRLLSFLGVFDAVTRYVQFDDYAVVHQPGRWRQPSRSGL
jgi:hypothetical protein